MVQPDNGTPISGRDVIEQVLNEGVGSLNSESVGNGTGPQVDPALALNSAPNGGHGRPRPPATFTQSDKRSENPLISPGDMNNNSDFVADQFVWVVNGKVVMFIEDHEDAGHGRVSLGVSDNGIDGWDITTNIIDDGVHHSFSQAFPYDGDWYMCLQSAAGNPNSIELWKSTSTPIPDSGWSKVRTLVDAGDNSQPWHDEVVDGCGFFWGETFWLLAGCGVAADNYGHLGGWYIPSGDLESGSVLEAEWAGFDMEQMFGFKPRPQGLMPQSIQDPRVFYFQDGGAAKRLKTGYLNELGPSYDDISMTMFDEATIPLSGSGWDSDIIHHGDVVYLHPNQFDVSVPTWRIYYDAQPASGSWQIGAADIPAEVIA